METKFRMIIYAIILGINGLIFFFLHSHFYFMLLAIMVVAPFLSFAMGWYLKRKISVSVKAAISSKNGEYSVAHDETYFTIKIDNPTVFMALDAKIEVEISNTFMGTSGTDVISVPVYIKKGYELSIPLISSYPGIVKLRINRICIKDLMGFFCFKKKVEAEAWSYVLPETIQMQDFNPEAFEMCALESEESTKKGNDFSDVSEIREYIPGDKLMKIHWKLSVKRDILMVKDSVSMSDKQMVILPELCNENIEALSGILTYTYSIIKKMIADNTTVFLMYFSSNNFDYQSARIDYVEDLNDTFSKMYYEKTYRGQDVAASHMSNVHPEIKSYIWISYDNNVFAKIKENG